MSIVDPTTLSLLDAYWRAANFLSAGQIYLRDNPLLREPLRADHIKPRLLGHWGTSPGLSLIYVHLNRLIRQTGAEMLYVCGPGHGAPAIVANAYLEGSYSDFFPGVTQDEEGIKKLFRQFSTPGGIPSHVSAHTPGSIHEGGELGYSLVHAFGAAFDNPDLIVACVIGDGEAETGPLAGSWKSTAFLNPARDGAVLPILHLNGYKISGPTVMGRMSDDHLRLLFSGHGYEVFIVEGRDPMTVHADMAATLDLAYASIRKIQEEARAKGNKAGNARWPMIILRTPKGWTGPKEWKGQAIEGTFRAHQVPLTGVREDPEKLKMLEEWMLGYRPAELFDEQGRLLPALQAMAPEGDKRLGATAYANGGALLKDLHLPAFRDYAVAVPSPGVKEMESTRNLGKYLRDVFALNKEERNFRLFCPDETSSNRLEAVFEVTDRCFMEETTAADDHLSPEGRVMEVLSEHCCQGWLEGYLLTGRHGIFPCYEAFITIVDSMFNQHAKWLKTCRELSWRRPVASLTYLLTSHSWRQDHNGYSHQGPGFIDTVVNKKSTVIRIYLPPDANTLLSVTDHCLKSRNYVNLIVAGKQPELQWLNMEDAIDHCARGASVWTWAGTAAGGQTPERGEPGAVGQSQAGGQAQTHESKAGGQTQSQSGEDQAPDVVLACAGDVPTLETVAAAWLLRQHVPGLRVQVVNVVDLMSLSPAAYHPHGMTAEYFESLFTDKAPVIFAFHGYVRIIHDLVHGRPDPARFHVRGFMEEGSTTTPFDMVVLNGMSRFHLAMEAVKRVDRIRQEAEGFIDFCENRLQEHRDYIRQYLDDLPDIRDWNWSFPAPLTGH